MTPVQYKVLSNLPTLQSDCLVQAKTGTGKTIAFLLPTIHSLLGQRALPKGQVAILILSPTRELALQIAKECSLVTSQLQPKPECHTAYGGTSKDRELKKFRDGDPKILVATPGRLNDYLSDESIAAKFANLRTLILDEADQMLEAGFLPAIRDILRRLPPKSRGWQGMCFSATMPNKIENVLPNVLTPGATRISTVEVDEIPTIDRVTQYSIVLSSVGDVFVTLLALLQREYTFSPNNFKVIVFGTTANGVNLLHSLFSILLEGDQHMNVFQLQSRLSQNVRTRTTNEFKATSAGIMFASDVIGRGMDFPNVSLVIQVGLPSSGEQYVHRVGRTARAGNEGRAVILLTQRESFFLKVNKHLPIMQYPEDLLSSAGADLQRIAIALDEIDEATKTKAYQAWLGFHKAYTKQLQLTNEGLVEQANEYAAALGCPEAPLLEKRIVGKMGLKGVRGLNVGQVHDGASTNHTKATGRSRSRGGHGASNGPNIPAQPRSDGFKGQRNEGAASSRSQKGARGIAKRNRRNKTAE